MKVQTIALAHLSPHPDNPRGKIAPADVAELAASIASNGLLSPLVVTPAAKAADRYIVLAGHRRLMALKTLERAEAACVVLDAGETDATSVMAKEREAELRWLADVLKLKLADHEKAAALEFPDPVARAPKPQAKASKPAPAPKAPKAAKAKKPAKGKAAKP